MIEELVDEAAVLESLRLTKSGPCRGGEPMRQGPEKDYLVLVVVLVVVVVFLAVIFFA